MERTSPVPLGSNSPMRAQSDSEDMGDNEDTNHKAPATNLPFGVPITGSNNPVMNSWGTSTVTTWANNNTISSLSTIPETGLGLDKMESHDDKLSKLKAKLEMKKKKLEDKRKENESKAISSSQVPLMLPSNDEATSLAEKNAIRFASNKNKDDSRSYLPTDLQSKIDNDNMLRNSGGRGNREDLENAISLVGTCLSKCPDEEILRREREGDVQLLEKPIPGKLHPINWTLRDTMVKRFRRSAADYKLDVPEWIRPPDILEQVCGYLEEWVMVSFFLIKVKQFSARVK